MSQQPVGRCLIAEVIGTFLLVFFGCGAVHAAVLMDGLVGLWQVGVVWGLAIMLAAYTVGPVSGAHLNPAVTLGLACCQRFPRDRVAGYLLAQLGGAALAASALHVLYQEPLQTFEAQRGIIRGTPASVLSAMCYGEYFLNPGGVGGTAPVDDAQVVAHLQRLPLASAFLAELLGTAILGWVIIRTTATHADAVPSNMAPVFIGLTVTALICVIAPLTQACFNPARDFGPRLIAYWAGWGSAAIPGPNGWGFLAVYGLAPILGAIGGMQLADWLAERPAASTSR
jgi:glycerol uptake facilitator protein